MIDKTGRIVWHDLFTDDRRRAMAFYRHVAGWDFKTEHATDFAWGGGAKDFVLALLEDEAGAGFAETPPGQSAGWIAYVEVPDVDATAAVAEKRGGTIVRAPFDVPGVGRNALLRDPLGALIGLSLSRHDFPAPQRQFGTEIYLTGAGAFPADFYSALFGWTVETPPVDGQAVSVKMSPSGEQVAVHLDGDAAAETPAVWIPSLRVTDAPTALRDTEAWGGRPMNRQLGHTPGRDGAFVADADDALVYLVADPLPTTG